jgi:hypothetical protein
MCGGDLSEPTLVTEQYLLDLEKEAFLSLCGEKKNFGENTECVEEWEACEELGEPELCSGTTRYFSHFCLTIWMYETPVGHSELIVT